MYHHGGGGGRYETPSEGASAHSGEGQGAAAKSGQRGVTQGGQVGWQSQWGLMGGAGPPAAPAGRARRQTRRYTPARSVGRGERPAGLGGCSPPAAVPPPSGPLPAPRLQRTHARAAAVAAGPRRAPPPWPWHTHLCEP